MMIRTAGGPGLISPIDFGEQKKPPSAKTLAIVGVVMAAHVVLGVALYNQRFELAPGEVVPEPPAIQLEFYRPPPKVEPTVTPQQPPAPNPPVHKTTAPTQPVETLAVNITDTPIRDPGTVITLSRPVEPEAPKGLSREPAAPVAAAPVITQPNWVSIPNGDQMARAYPDRAQAAGISGSATLRCLVRVDGGLNDCSVVSETPSGRGFGSAATRLSRYFRMSPRTIDGQPVGGAAVTFAIRFTLPD